MKKIIIFVLVAVLAIALVGCGTKSDTNTGSNNNTATNNNSSSANSNESSNAAVNNEITLATTTSTENSGLLDYILPEMEKDTGLKIKVVAVGTGQALELGKNGDADVLLVHAKDSEIKFVQEGYGVERIEVMYNDFILVGPKDDPMEVQSKFPKDILKAMALLGVQEGTFISRGDDSGTHKMELALWKSLDFEPKGGWYISAGQGMGKVLQMAHEMDGYTLTDRATYLSMQDTLELKVVVEGDSLLFNQYGVIAVSKEKHPTINLEGANKFIEWITSEKGQGMIAEFGKDKYGQSLFIPNATK